MSALISVADALEAIISARPPRRTQTLPLADALGATLAAPVTAKLSRPPAAVSAMDGYAVHLDDVIAPDATLKVIGEAPAGTPFTRTVSPGEAVRIFTGGELPHGTDHVIMQEEATRVGAQVTFSKAYDTHAFVRAAGLDFQSGAPLIEAGTRIGPAELAVAAAANHATLTTWQRPRVALLANGNELREPGSPLGPGQIVNSNPAGLSALIRSWGGEAQDLGIAADSIDDIIAHLNRASDADIIVPVGGASVGDHDHMRAAFDAAGYELIFEKIAVKPGKPTWLARKGHQTALGLPGNPASALVCAHLFLKPLMQFGRAFETLPATTSVDLPENGPREEFLRARVTWSTTGLLQVTPHDNQDSSLLTPFLTANALIRRTPHAGALTQGDTVDIILLSMPD